MGLLRPFVSAAGYLVAPANIPAIRKQWREIRDLTDALRDRSVQDDSIVLGPGFHIDFEASAQKLRTRAQGQLDMGFAQPENREMASVTGDELRLILQQGRRETVRRTWSLFAACGGFTALWLGCVAVSPAAYVSAYYVLLWLGFMLSVGALALREMWSNWNIRCGRRAPFSEFLRTEESWIPR